MTEDKLKNTYNEYKQFTYVVRSSNLCNIHVPINLCIMFPSSNNKINKLKENSK